MNLQLSRTLYSLRRTISFSLAILMFLTVIPITIILSFNLNSSSSNHLGAVSAGTYQSSAISLSNSSFESTTGAAYPRTPRNWTLHSDNRNSQTTSGVISLDKPKESDYEDYDDYIISLENFNQRVEDEYELSFTPKAHNDDLDNKNVLMINSKDNKSYHSYYSSTFNMEKQGYFEVQVWAKTQNDDDNSSNASIYLANEDTPDIQESGFYNLNTLGNWKRYSFLIKTHSLQEVNNLKLNLSLGSNSTKSMGSVFFDDINIYSHSHETFQNILNSTNPGDENYTLIDLNEGIIEGAIENSDFEDGIENWTLIDNQESNPHSEYATHGVYYINDSFYSQNLDIQDSPGTANIYDNSKALLIQADESNRIGYKSDEFLIEQHRFYSLSIMVKADNMTSGGASLKVEQQNPYSEEIEYEPIVDSIENIQTSSVNTPRFSDWAHYTFLIKGNPFMDTSANLELWLGNEESNAVGYAFFDNIQLQEISAKLYYDVQDSNEMQKVDFSGISENTTISNPYFNNVYNEDISPSYPMVPRSWEHFSKDDAFDSEQNKSGIINTKPSIFDSNEISNITNPGYTNPDISLTDISNNILMMQNMATTQQTFESTGETLEKGSYYKLSFYVQTQNLSSNNITLELADSDTTHITIRNLKSEYTWTKHTYYVKSHDLLDLDFSIYLNLGTELSYVSGTAFFDNIDIDQVEKEDFNAAAASKSVDLSIEQFNSKGDLNEFGLYESKTFTKTNVASNESFSGILDTTNFDINQLYFPGIDNPQTASSDSKNALTIRNIEPGYYRYNSNLNFKFEKDNYYEISVWVKTAEISGTNDSEKKPGAGISITGKDINKTITGINSEDDVLVENEYKEYTFYISASSSDDVDISLFLGDNESHTSGYAFFSDIQIKELSSTDYNENIEQLNEYSFEVLGDQEIPEEDPIDDEQPTPGVFEELDPVLIPTLIMGIALIFAILGYIIRKIKFNSLLRSKIKSELYDRTKSLELDHKAREDEEKRKEKLDKLKTELDNIKKDIEEISKTQEQEKAKKLESLSKDLEQKTAKDSISDREVRSVRRKKERKIKLESKIKYSEKRKKLVEKFNRIEKEIEELEKMERLLFERYKYYKAQVKSIKKDLRQRIKNEKIRKRKNKKNKKRSK